MRRRSGGLLAVWAVVVAGAQLQAPELAAQGARLDQVEEHIRNGRLDDARTVLDQWWSSDRATARPSALERGIWLRARLTRDPDAAGYYLRRIVTEFPEGRFAEQAEERLTQLALLMPEDAANPDTRDPDARDRSDTDPDEAEPRPPPTPEPTEVRRATPSASEAGPISVQFGAFRFVSQTDKLAGGIRAAGYEPRVVGLERDDLVRVRVGRFTDRADAQRLLRELEAHGFRGYVVFDAASERDPGGGE